MVGGVADGIGARPDDPSLQRIDLRRQPVTPVTPAPAPGRLDRAQYGIEGIAARIREAGFAQRAGEFDVVVCQQGLQFFPDKSAATRQMRRALAERGRLAVSTWRSDEEHPVLRELRRVAERHLGPIVDVRHGYGAAEPLEALLRDAGFDEVRVKTRSRTIRFDDASVFVRLNAMALIGMSASGKEISDEKRAQLAAAIAHDSIEVVQPHTGETGFTFELSANVATAKG